MEREPVIPDPGKADQPDDDPYSDASPAPYRWRRMAMGSIVVGLVILGGNGLAIAVVGRFFPVMIAAAPPALLLGIVGIFRPPLFAAALDLEGSVHLPRKTQDGARFLWLFSLAVGIAFMIYLLRD